MQTQDDIDMVDDGPPAWLESVPPVGLDPDLADPDADGDGDSDLADWLDPLSDDGSPPTHFTADAVEFIGEPRFQIWRGRQFCITGRGIQRRDGAYAIPAAMIWDPGIIRKALAIDGVDIDDFKEALRLARRVHQGD